MTNDWEYMMNFADELLKHAEDHQQNNRNLNVYVSERISIIHFDHALELLMKAYLMKEEYIIYKPNPNKLKNGIKESADIAEILFEDQTLGFPDLVKLFFKISNIPVDDGKNSKIIKFHNLRNEIQHRSLVSSAENKTIRLRDLKPVIRFVYENAFENRQYPLNSHTNKD